MNEQFTFPHPTNGDQTRYADQANTYTKGLPHDTFGRVDLNAFATLVRALRTGEPEDFEQIILGGTRTLNGPQGGYAFCSRKEPDSREIGRLRFRETLQMDSLTNLPVESNNTAEIVVS